MASPPSRPARAALCRALSAKLPPLALAAVLQPTLAAEQALDFDIPPQALGTALNAYADQANVQMSYPAALTAGLKSPGVAGHLSPQQALQKLLAGTGIHAHTTANGTVTLEKPAPAPHSVPSPAPAKPAAPTSGAAVLPTVTVTAKTDYGISEPYSKEYAATHSGTATKTETPILETPMSVQVVPQAVLKDQQVVRIEDALKNVSGVRNDSSYGSANTYDSFMVRGFTLNSGMYRNGLRLSEQSFEMANLDRIEVLKGPASALYGRTEAGGLVNMATKRPLEEAYYSLGQQFGSYDFYRTTLDATGPVTADGSLLYRLNMAYQDAQSYRDYTPKERIFIAPSILWRPNDRDELFINFEYRNDTFHSDNGIPPLNGRPAPVPITWSVNDGNAPKDRLETYTVGMEASRKLNDSWKITNRFMFNQANYNWNTLWQSGVIPDTTLVGRSWVIVGPGQTDTYATNLDLTGHFDTFGVKHELLLGYDYYKRERYDYDNYWSSLDIPPQDLFNPRQGNVVIRGVGPGGLIDSYWRDNSQWQGLYLQDQMTFFDQVHLLFGGRYDHAEQAAGYASTPDVKLDSNTVDALKPRVGLVYQPLPWLSVYGHYVESLGTSNSGVSFAGNLFGPQTAEEFEGGVKGEFFGGRLSSSLAYFYLTKQNILAPDPAHPNFSLAVGEARSQGLEWDMTGRITEDFSLIGSYAYTDAVITKDTPATEGNRLYNVPEHAASLWGKYELTENFSFGSGVYIVGQREGDLANTYQLPGYVRWDMMASYHQPIGKSKLTVQLNVNNVLDKKYYASSNGAYQITPGTPLFLMGSVKLEY